MQSKPDEMQDVAAVHIIVVARTRRPTTTDE